MKKKRERACVSCMAQGHTIQIQARKFLTHAAISSRTPMASPVDVTSRFGPRPPNARP